MTRSAGPWPRDQSAGEAGRISIARVPRGLGSVRTSLRHRLRPGRGRGSDVAGLYSCVIDSAPRFHVEALRWYATLTGVAGVAAQDIVVNLVGGTESEATEFLAEQGVRLQAVEAFDPRSPHCNKISAATELARRGYDGLAVLTDTDVVVLDDARRIAVGRNAVAFKLVDGPNPPFDLLERVFAAAELPLPPVEVPDCEPTGRTVRGNGNGGVIALRAPALRRLVPAWARWSRWLLDTDVQGDWRYFTDQVAMALALASEDIGVQYLPRRWNFPVHIPKYMDLDPSRPAVIHYHDRAEANGLLSPTGRPAIDQAIAEANEAIDRLLRDSFAGSPLLDVAPERRFQ